MSLAQHRVLIALCVLSSCSVWGAPALSQSLHKCSNAQGQIEYRNSPCEAAQKDTGKLKQGTVTQMKLGAEKTSSGGGSDSGAKSTSGDVSGIPNPVKWLRADAAPLDMTEVALCKSEGGFYVQGAGCMNEPPRNRNPLIGEVKMREICNQTNKQYVKALNECFAKKS